MKKAVVLTSIMAFLAISSQCFSQAVALGDNADDVYSVLHYRVGSYNNSQGVENQQTIDVKHLNGAISEIIVSVTDGYLYDIGLNSSYAIHYCIKAGVLDHIITQYENLSVGQLKDAFNRLYGERHLGSYYFSADYKYYKIITLGDNGLATINEESTYKGNFPPNITSLLSRQGVTITNSLPPSKKSTGANQGALYKPNRSTTVNNYVSRSFVTNPTVSNNSRISGIVVVDFTVDRNGDIMEAHTNTKYTTVTDTSLLKSCEIAVKTTKVNPAPSAPISQKGQFKFVFHAD